MTTQSAKFEVTDPSLVDDLIGSNAAGLLARKISLAAGISVVRGQVLGGNDTEVSTTGAVFGIAAVDVDGDTDSPPAAKEVLVFTRGSFNEHALVLGSYVLATIRPLLRAQGIYLETPVQRYPAA